MSPECTSFWTLCSTSQIHRDRDFGDSTHRARHRSALSIARALPASSAMRKFDDCSSGLTDLAGSLCERFFDDAQPIEALGAPRPQQDALEVALDGRGSSSISRSLRRGQVTSRGREGISRRPTDPDGATSKCRQDQGDRAIFEKMRSLARDASSGRQWGYDCVRHAHSMTAPRMGPRARRAGYLDSIRGRMNFCARQGQRLRLI